MENEVSPKATCKTCAFWMEDDDTDGNGTCVLRLSRKCERKWRTPPDFGCELWGLYEK